ncbi:nuclear transport factor 2 family protein [Sphingosinicella microcystinivorans]|uniref:Steroid Delta-isomerase n=1 Tax=Sphingosinicella microcystinivorans TaxID=335406 RepID=A0AAD1D8F9_SPHMI|nr:nuclear transport factor 2 family protein [Sphingosinicella microcystinivorans]RKS94297.1 hypothetical protein DFR51_0003 [Sphingosinicella microcystinivorans]BBE35283.1 steroid Delta-isomerase [Sphingosinicella microcystinivorans]
MSTTLLPHEIVDRQLKAYNARDIDLFCSHYAPDAALYNLNTGEPIARGLDAIRTRYIERFRSPDLRCVIESRIQLANLVVDHESVEGISEERQEVVAIYEVTDHMIGSVRFLWPSPKPE